MWLLLDIASAACQHTANAVAVNPTVHYCYAHGPVLQDWENKTLTAMQKHKGVLLLARARAQVSSSTVESRGEPRALNHIYFYTDGSLFL